MDYNILNAYSQIYDYKDSNKLIFLPLSGLGGKGDTESSDKNNKELMLNKDKKYKISSLLQNTAYPPHFASRQWQSRTSYEKRY